MLKLLLILLQELIRLREENASQELIDLAQKRVSTCFRYTLLKDKSENYSNDIQLIEILLKIVQADWVEGIAFYKENYELLVLKKYPDDNTIWDFACVYNAKKIQHYLLSHYPDKTAKQYIAQLQVAINTNNTNQIRELISDAKTKTESKEIFLTVISRCHSEIATNLIMDYFLQNKIDDLINLIKDIKKNLNNWIIDLYINLISKQTSLTIDEKLRLLEIPVQFIFLDASYKTKQQFIDTYNRVLSIIPQNDTQARDKLNKIITDLISSTEDIYHTILWDLHVTDKVQLKVNNSYQSFVDNTAAHLDLTIPEKIQIYYELTQKEFDTQLGDISLIDSITNKQPITFHYKASVMKEEIPSIILDDEENLAHLAVEQNFPVAVYALFQSHPELFSMRNSEGKLPLDLAEKNSVLRKLLDPKWKIYNDMKQRFLSVDCYYNTLMDDPKWGCLPKRLIVYLNNIEEFISLLSKKDLNDAPIYACYQEISAYLFYTLTGVWTHTQCRHDAISKLLIQYSHFAKSKLLSNEEFCTNLISCFSRFGNDKYALYFLTQLYESKKKNLNSDLRQINILRFAWVGLAIKKLTNKEPIEAFYYPVNLLQNYYESMIDTLRLGVCASSINFTTIAKNELEEFEATLKKSELNNTYQTKTGSELLLYAAAEACTTFIHWADHFYLTSSVKAGSAEESNINNHKKIFLDRIQNIWDSPNALGDLKTSIKIEINPIESSKKSHHKKTTSNPPQPSIGVSPNQNLSLRLFFSLNQAITQINSDDRNQEIIDFEENVALSIIQILGLDYLLKMNTGEGSIIFEFAKADFAKCIQYISDRTSILLPPLAVNHLNKNLFYVALESRATNVIKFCQQLHLEKQFNLFRLDLEEAIYNNKKEDVQKYITPDTFLDSLEYACYLNRFDLFKFLFENDKYQEEINYTVILTTVINQRNPVFIDYLLDDYFKNKRLDVIEACFEKLYARQIQGTHKDFLKLFLKKLKSSPSLTINEKFKLIYFCLCCVMVTPHWYTNKDEFIKDFKEIKLLFPNKKEYKAEIRESLLSIIETVFNETHQYPITNHLLLEEKLHYLDITAYDLADCGNEELRNKWCIDFLIRSIKEKKSLLMVYYFLSNSKYLNYHDKETGNTLAHIAVIENSDSDFIHALRLLNPKLFNQKNNDGKLPQDLSLYLKELMNEKWKIFDDLKTEFAHKHYYFVSPINSNKWGELPHRFVYLLEIIEKSIMAWRHKTIELPILQNSYNLLINKLIESKASYWDFKKGNITAIVETLYQFYEFGNSHHLNDSSSHLFFIALFSKYYAYEKSLIGITKFFQRDNDPLLDINIVHIMGLLTFGLHASKMIAPSSFTLFNSFKYGNNPNEQLLHTIIFKFLSPTGSINLVSLEVLNQFQVDISKINIDMTQPTSEPQLTDDQRQLILISFLIMLNWINRSFSLDAKEESDFSKLKRIAEIKIVALEKLNQLLLPIINKWRHSQSDPYKRSLTIQTQINNDIQSAKEASKLLRNQNKKEKNKTPQNKSTGFKKEKDGPESPATNSDSNTAAQPHQEATSTSSNKDTQFSNQTNDMVAVDTHKQTLDIQSSKESDKPKEIAADVINSPVSSSSTSAPLSIGPLNPPTTTASNFTPILSTDNNKEPDKKDSNESIPAAKIHSVSLFKKYSKFDFDTSARSWWLDSEKRPRLKTCDKITEILAINDNAHQKELRKQALNLISDDKISQDFSNDQLVEYRNVILEIIQRWQFYREDTTSVYIEESQFKGLSFHEYNLILQQILEAIEPEKTKLTLSHNKKWVEKSYLDKELRFYNAQFQEHLIQGSHYLFGFTQTDDPNIRYAIAKWYYQHDIYTKWFINTINHLHDKTNSVQYDLQILTDKINYLDDTILLAQGMLPINMVKSNQWYIPVDSINDFSSTQKVRQLSNNNPLYIASIKIEINEDEVCIRLFSKHSPHLHRMFDEAIPKRIMGLLKNNNDLSRYIGNSAKTDEFILLLPFNDFNHMLPKLYLFIQELEGETSALSFQHRVETFWKQVMMDLQTKENQTQYQNKR